MVFKKGYKPSKETREKISKALKGTKSGNKNPFFHKELSEEHRKKISESVKKLWMTEDI